MRERGRRCIVPSCRFLSRSDLGKRSMFKIPKDEEKARLWAALIPGITEPFHKHQTVCEIHFEPRFINRFQEKTTNIVRVRLHPKAIPTIFNNENLNSNGTQVKYPDNKYTHSKSKIGRSTLHVSNTFLDSRNQPINNENLLCNVVKDLNTSQKILMDIKQEMFVIPEDAVKHENLDDDRVKTETDYDTKELTAYEQLDKNFSYYITQLPENWHITRLSVGTDPVFALSKECTVSENDALMLMNERSIVINKRGNVHYSIHGKMVNFSSSYTPNHINDIDSLLEIIMKFDEAKVCQGICPSEYETHKYYVIYKDDLSYSRHINCSLLADKQQCDACWEYSQYLVRIVDNVQY